MSWALSGTYFENCTCEGACPCTASSFQWPADKDFCDVMFAFHVDSGEIDGTAVEDRSVVLLVHIPQAQATDGNWKLGLYVDERASAEQAEKLGAVFGASSAARWPRSLHWSARLPGSNGRRSPLRTTG